MGGNYDSSPHDSSDLVKEGRSRDAKVTFRGRIIHFTWAWFDCTMSTGALATLLGQQPHKFPGLFTIGKVVFIFDIVLFLTLCALLAYRFALIPRAFTSSLHHPFESFYFGAFWVSIAFILYSTSQYGGPSCGPWLVKTLEVCYWAYAACALLVAVFQYHVIFDEEKLPVFEAMPAWILPAYPFIVLGPLAGQLLYTQPQEAAIPMLLGGLMFAGLGWTIALIMYTIYFTRLINSQIPDEPKRPGMYIAVGPAAYTATTLITLGTQAVKVLPPSFMSFPGDAIPVGYIWKAIGLPAGLFLWLIAFWFSALSTASVLFGIKQMKFDLSWWAFIYPNVGLTIAAINVGKTVGSSAIGWVCSAATILLVLAWLLVAGWNIKALYYGEVLFPGEDEDMEDIEGHPADDGMGNRNHHQR
jgi:C4-dicarboxylate transporter/malic acid transport protein